MRLRAHAPLVAASLLAVCLCLPSLFSGLSTDDYFHRAYILHHLEGDGGPRPWDIFNLMGRRGERDVEALVLVGLLPWWTDPEFSFAALRPLAALTHYVDYMLWPDSPLLMHVHNLLWLALIVWLGGLCYLRLLGPTATAWLALGMFAVDDARAQGVGWVASRNTLMTGAFVLAAFLAHMRARGGSRVATFAMPALVLLGLSSSEGGVSVWALLLPFALFLDQGTWAQRLRPLAVPAVITGVWFVRLNLIGYGARGSGAYLNPFLPSRHMFGELFNRLQYYTRELLLVSHAGDLFLPQYTPLFVGASAAVFVLLAAALAILWRRRPQRFLFWIAAAVVPMFPAMLAFSSPRLLLIAAFGASGLVAEILHEAWSQWRQRPSGGVASRGLLAAAGLCLGMIHLPLSAAQTPFASTFADQLEEIATKAIAAFPGAQAEGKIVLVLNTSSYLLTDMGARRGDPNHLPRGIAILGAADAPVSVTRRSKTTLVLEPQGGYLNDYWSILMRDPSHGFRVGARYQVGGVMVVVEEITLDGRPSRIAVTHVDPEVDHLLWLAYRASDNHYDVVTLPAVGERLQLLP